jgi:hypothetical protein
MLFFKIGSWSNSARPEKERRHQERPQNFHTTDKQDHNINQWKQHLERLMTITSLRRHIIINEKAEYM